MQQFRREHVYIQVWHCPLHVTMYSSKKLFLWKLLWHICGSTHQQINDPRSKRQEAIKAATEILKQTDEDLDTGVRRVLLEPASVSNAHQVLLHQLGIHCKYTTHTACHCDQPQWTGYYIASAYSAYQTKIANTSQIDNTSQNYLVS